MRVVNPGKIYRKLPGILFSKSYGSYHVLTIWIIALTTNSEWRLIWLQNVSQEIFWKKNFYRQINQDILIIKMLQQRGEEEGGVPSIVLHVWYKQYKGVDCMEFFY